MYARIATFEGATKDVKAAMTEATAEARRRG